MHWQTHTVFNQPMPLNNSNLYLSDGALCEAVTREGAGWDSDFLASIGQQLGTAESLELGRLANVNPPELLRYDAGGGVWTMCVFTPPAPADAGAMYQSGAQSCGKKTLAPAHLWRARRVLCCTHRLRQGRYVR